MKGPDTNSAFAFSSEDYDGLLHTTLGKFDFQSIPVLFPEEHHAFESSAMNQIHLLATAEHEQVHDMLARQTTHGYLILLGVRFARKINPEQANQVLPPLQALHHEARAIHEAYAVFSTLCTNRLYQPMLDTLTPEYVAYRQKAEAMLPMALESTRLGRDFVYAAVLIALSPAIPEPDPGLSAVENLQKAIRAASGCEVRWASLLDWKIQHEETARALCETAAIAENYSGAQLDLPIYFDAAPEQLTPADLATLEQRETQLIQRLMLDLAAHALPKEPPPVLVTDLPKRIQAWRDLLAPQFRLESRFAETTGMDALRFGYLDRVFQENLRSTLLAGPVPTVHHLCKNYDALNRIATHLFDGGLRLNVCGYITDSLSERSRRNFEQHLSLEPRPLHIQWSLMSADLSIYQQEKLEILFSFEHTTLESLDPETAGRFFAFISPADLVQKPTFQSLCQRLAMRRVQVFVLQPLNFLTFMEWRLEKGLPIASFKVTLVHFDNENAILMRVRFAEELFEHIRLVSLSTVLGLDNLQSIAFFEIEIENRSTYNDTDLALANFWKMYWR